jgi:hypothetical protein
MVILVVLAAQPPLAPGASAGPTSYDWEACEQGWSASHENTWQRVPMGAGGSEYAVGYPLYEGDSVAAWVSPVHTSTGSVTVAFDARWQVENPATGIDVMDLEWSNDPRSKVWTKAKAFGGFTNPGFPDWSPQKVTFKVPPGQFKVRFQMASDQLMPGLGFYIDNVTIDATNPKPTKCDG